MRLRWGWAVHRVLSHVLVLAVVPAIAAPAVGEEPAAPGFTGLERLYFERLEDPGRTPGLPGGDGQGVRSRVLRELLPAELGEGEEPRDETAVVEVPEGPVHGGLRVRDWRLGAGDVFLRQVVLADHPRIRETVWGLYSGGRRTDLWFFSPLPQRTDSKLLPPIVVEEVLRADGEKLVLRASGSMARPQGAAWFHGVDLVFAVEGDALRYRYGVRRYSFVYGYDRGAGQSVLVAVEVPREEDGGTVVERRVIHDLTAEAAAGCGVPEHEMPAGSFEELVDVATCITSSPGAVVERRGTDEPSFIERGGGPSPTPRAGIRP